MGSKLTTLFSISSLRGYALSATAALLEYNTVKLVHIHNKKVGIVNRLVQLVIVGYILG
jgi:P2X purinoceptor 4